MKLNNKTLKNFKYDKINNLYISKITRHKYIYVEKCKYCNEPFLGMISSSKIYCSKDCMKKDKVGKNNPAYKHGKTLKKVYCVSCGKLLSDYKSKRCLSCRPQNKVHVKNCKCPFCKANRGELKGKNHPHYIDGRSFEEYPAEFNDKLKIKIRKRDNYICKNCGITEEEHIIIFGQVLHIHHIDYDKQNCKEDNLVATCISCNARANYNKEYWKEFYKSKIVIKNFKEEVRI